MSSGQPLTRDYTTGLVSLIDETSDTVNAQTVAPVTTNANLSIDANGTGEIRLGYNGGGGVQDTHVYGDLNVDGAEVVTGGTTFNGNVTIGDAAADLLVINASLNSSIVLNANDTFNIGSNTAGLSELWISEVGGSTARNLNASTAGAAGAKAIGVDPTPLVYTVNTDLQSVLEDIESNILDVEDGLTYVDVVNGSNTTGTGTRGKPYQTLAYACTQFSNPANFAEFDTPIIFRVAPGTYSDNVTLPYRKDISIIGDEAKITGDIHWGYDLQYWYSEDPEVEIASLSLLSPVQNSFEFTGTLTAINDAPSNGTCVVRTFNSVGLPIIYSFHNRESNSAGVDEYTGGVLAYVWGSFPDDIDDDLDSVRWGGERETACAATISNGIWLVAQDCTFPGRFHGGMYLYVDNCRFLNDVDYSINPVTGAGSYSGTIGTGCDGYVKNCFFDETCTLGWDGVTNVNPCQVNFDSNSYESFYGGTLDNVSAEFLDTSRGVGLSATFSYDLDSVSGVVDDALEEIDIRLRYGQYNRAREWVKNTFTGYPAAYDYRGICFGNGRFVTVASDGIASSEDGLYWETHTNPTSNTVGGVCYGNGRFVAVANTGTGDRVIYSDDGKTWTAASGVPDRDWNAVCWGDGKFVAVASSGTGDRVMTSPDGEVWTLQTSAADNDWQGVCWGQNQFVAIANSGTTNRVMTSPNGETWTIRSDGDLTEDYTSICYGNGWYVAVSNSGTYRIVRSNDGINWDGISTPAYNDWQGICYGNGMFVAVASSGTGDRIMVCHKDIPGASGWEVQANPDDNDFKGVCFGNGVFVAIANNGSVRAMSSGRPIDSIVPQDNYYNGAYIFTNEVGIGTSDLYGRLTIKAVSAGNIIVGQDSSGTDVVVIDEDGHLTLADGIYLDGKYVETINKNKTQVYLEDSVGNFLIYQNYYWTGSAWSSTSNYGVGSGALLNNEGRNCNAFGYLAGQNNTGDYCDFSGYSAGQNNTGGQCYFGGNISGRNNTGDFCTGLGRGSLTSNIGDNVFGLGFYSGSDNIAGNVTFIGYYCGRYNKNSNNIDIGYYNSYQSTAGSSIHIGDNSCGLYAAGSNNIAIGYGANNSFMDNTSGDKTFDYTDIDVGTDRITITAHGFGGTGTYHNIKYTEGTSPITGLSDGDILQILIVDANTIELTIEDITAAGTGTGHTLTPQYEYDNSIVMGANQDPSADNQVILGNSSVVQTILRGLINFEVGDNLASANDMSVPTGGNLINVTGATQINTMATTDIVAGTVIILKFASNPTVKHSTAGTGASFILNGSSDLSPTAGSILMAVWDGTYWTEISRMVV